MEAGHRNHVSVTPHYRDYAPLRFSPDRLAPDHGELWMAAGLWPLLAHVDRSGSIEGPIALASPGGSREIRDLAVEEGKVWANLGTELALFDPETGRQRFLAISGRGLAVGGGAWTIAERRLTRVDPLTLSPEPLAPVGEAATCIAVSGNVVWVMIWDAPDRTLVVRIDPVSGDVLGTTVITGRSRSLTPQSDGVVARVWRSGEAASHEDILVTLASDASVIDERQITPVGAETAVCAEGIWVSGLDPFDSASIGWPSAIHRLLPQGGEEQVRIHGTADRLAGARDTVWARVAEQGSDRGYCLMELDDDGERQRHYPAELDLRGHQPPPPPPVDVSQLERDTRDRLARSLFGGWVSTDPDTGRRTRGPFIKGVRIEDVRLEGGFPETSVVVLFRTEWHGGLLFGRRRRLWDDDGAFSGVIDVMDVNLMEDVLACGHGLPSNPIPDEAGICWF